MFTTGDDPVQVDLVTSINRPGGNLTGAYIFFSELDSRKLGLPRELVPQAVVIAALVNPSHPTAKNQATELRAAAHNFGQQILIINANSERELDTAFASMAQSQVGSLLVAADRFFNTRRKEIVSLAARYAISAVYEQRAFATAGGLMSYGTKLPRGLPASWHLHGADS